VAACREKAGCSGVFTLLIQRVGWNTLFPFMVSFLYSHI